MLAPLGVGFGWNMSGESGVAIEANDTNTSFQTWYSKLDEGPAPVRRED